jgi:hypothetical protein
MWGRYNRMDYHYFQSHHATARQIQSFHLYREMGKFVFGAKVPMGTMSLTFLRAYERQYLKRVRPKRRVRKS